MVVDFYVKWDEGRGTGGERGRNPIAPHSDLSKYYSSLKISIAETLTC
jgi:hypothetical protein